MPTLARTLGSVAVLCTLLAASQGWAQPSPAAAGAKAGQRPPKKLIEFGWDEPDTAFMRAHLAEMEATLWESITRLAPPDTPVPCAANLENAYLPGVEQITGKAKELLS